MAVGGSAVAAHGHDRPAADLDLLFVPSATNKALIVEAAAPWKTVEPKTFAEEHAWLRFEDLPVDMIPRVPGPSASIAVAGAIQTAVGALSVPTLSLEHLLMNKGYTRRPEDRLSWRLRCSTRGLERSVDRNRTKAVVLELR